MNMRSKTTRLLSVLIPLVCVEACAQKSNVDLGTNVTGASLADYVDGWDGYTEARQFVPGSDRIRVKIGADGQGTLVLGESQTYPPATDPNVGYPLGEDANSIITDVYMFRPGFEYPLRGVKVESKRIRFTVSMNDFYKTWCELQTPVVASPDNPDVYSCAPSSFRSDGATMCFAGGDPGVPIDCGKALLCSLGSVCTCTASSCTANTDFNSDSTSVQFDGALREQGTQLEGTFNNANVRLERQ
jgi:hypothetical protein